MKITVIGADGQLGTDLCKQIPSKDIIPLTIKDIDITDPRIVDRVLGKHSPDVVINTAAYHKVDDCEDNVLPAFEVNSFGPKYLARTCKRIGAKLVHISTDYVFKGGKKKPYIESDLTEPISTYGISKLDGELFVKYELDRHFIVRTSGLYGIAGCLGKGGTNFIEGMLKRVKTMPEIKVVTDEILTPTYTFELAGAILQLIKTDKYGVYHITNNGQCSWFDFTKKLFEYLGVKNKLIPVDGRTFPTKAKRPKYSVLENAALQGIGLNDLSDWQKALKAYLVEKGHLK